MCRKIDAGQVFPLLITVCCTILIGACQAKPVTPTIESTATIVAPTATATPSASPTPPPTATPTAALCPLPTPFPPDYLNAFLPEHAIARFGKGMLGWRSINLSPDGRLLMVTSTVATTIYDAETFEEIWSVQGRGGREFSPDSERIIAIGNQEFTIHDTGSGRVIEKIPSGSRFSDFIWLADGSLYTYYTECHYNYTHIWNMRNEEKFTVEGCILYCTGGGCSRHNPLLALSSGATNSVVDLRTGEKLWEKSFTSGEEIIQNLLWSPAGDMAVFYLCGPHECISFVVDAASGEIIHTLEKAHPVSWSDDGTKAVFLIDSEYQIVDALTWKSIATLDNRKGDNNLVFGVFDWSADASILVGDGNHCSTMMVWDTGTGEQLQAIQHPFIDLLYGPNVIISPDQETIYVSVPNRLTQWEISTGEAIHTLEGYDYRVEQKLAWSPDGQQLAMGRAGEVYIVDLNTLERVNHHWINLNSIESLEWNAEGDKIYGRGERYSPNENVDFIWDIGTGELEEGEYRNWSPNREYYIYQEEGTFSVGDAATGEILWSREEGYQYSLWSSDGRMLAIATNDHISEPSDEDGPWEARITIYDAETGDIIQQIDEQGTLLMRLEWSPDGSLIAGEEMGMGPMQWFVWDATTGEKLYTFRSIAAAFSLDSTILAMQEDDRTIGLRNARTGENILSLEGHSDFLWDLAWSPDGHFLASSAADGDATVIIWQIEP